MADPENGTVAPPGERGPPRKDPYAKYTAANPQPPGRHVCVDCKERFPEDEMISDNLARWRCMPCARRLLAGE